MAGFSDNDIEKSPWAVGKAWAHDTLAYRGSNIWKCISVPDRGEDEGVSGARSIHKREEMAFAVTTSYQFPMWTQPNPAFGDRGGSFRFELVQTSHLKSNLICQHPHFCLISL